MVRAALEHRSAKTVNSVSRTTFRMNSNAILNGIDGTGGEKDCLTRRIGEKWLQDAKSWRQSDQEVRAIEEYPSAEAAKARLTSFARAGLSYDDRRVLRRWILRKCGYGDREMCSQCRSHSITVYHAQECLGVDVDILCRTRKWEEAVREVRRAIRLTGAHRFRSKNCDRGLTAGPSGRRRRPEAPDDWGGSIRNVRRRIE